MNADAGPSAARLRGVEDEWKARDIMKIEITYCAA
jgi:hypothetical protein